MPLLVILFGLLCHVGAAPCEYRPEHKIHVAINGTDEEGCGVDHDSACESIAFAFSQIPGGETPNGNYGVFVSPGVYTGLGNCALSLRGSLLAVEGAAHIDCAELGVRVIASTSSVPGQFIIMGITLRGGNAAIVADVAPMSAGDGGGMRISEDTTGPFCINECVFENNFAATWGGGIYAGLQAEGNVIRDSVFRANSVGDPENPDWPGQCAGGGAWLRRGHVLVENCTFRDNEATSASDIQNVFVGGGAVAASSGQVFVDCTFEHNRANNGFGGAAIFDGDVSLTDSAFTSNTANSGGAAVCIGACNLVRVQVKNNTASAGNGGGLHISSGGLVDRSGLANIRSSTFFFNTARGRTDSAGGGLYVSQMGNPDTMQGGHLLRASTVQDNSAAIGGGLAVFESIVRTPSATFSDNVATVGPQISCEEVTPALQGLCTTCALHTKQCPECQRDGGGCFSGSSPDQSFCFGAEEQCPQNCVNGQPEWGGACNCANGWRGSLCDEIDTRAVTAEPAFIGILSWAVVATIAILIGFGIYLGRAGHCGRKESGPELDALIESALARKGLKNSQYTATGAVVR